MTTPTTGRGSWTRRGMSDNSTIHYQFKIVSGWRMLGSQPTRDADHYAIHLAVNAIQARVNEVKAGLGLAGGAPIVVDGVFGNKTAAAVTVAQRALALDPDGVVGPKTTKALWRPLLVSAGPISADLQCGLVQKESGWDPGAVGYSTPSDNGLVQINLSAHPTVTREQAFDPYFAVGFMRNYLADALTRYEGRLEIAIAHYNSPTSAKEWARTGTAPNPTIAAYVADVLKGCP